MKFHTQTLLVKEHGQGNCYQTTIACLLDAEPYQIPNIEVWFDVIDENHNNYWDYLLGKFLKQKYQVREVASLDLWQFHTGKSDFPEQFRDIEYMVSDLSPRGIQHVVIYKNGEMIHDCHPDRNGIIVSDKCYCSYLEKINNLA